MSKWHIYKGTSDSPKIILLPDKPKDDYFRIGYLQEGSRIHINLLNNNGKDTETVFYDKSQDDECLNLIKKLMQIWPQHIVCTQSKGRGKNAGTYIYMIKGQFG